MIYDADEAFGRYRDCWSGQLDVEDQKWQQRCTREGVADETLFLSFLHSHQNLVLKLPRLGIADNASVPVYLELLHEGSHTLGWGIRHT